MRRTLPIVLAALALAACGSSAAKPPALTTAGTAAGADTTTAATNDLGVTKPSVSLPPVAPTQLVVTERRAGTGAKAAAGDKLEVNYIGVRFADGQVFDNSYDRGQSFELTLGQGQVIKGWDEGLVGAQTGGQYQLDMPASLAYGDAGAGTKIKPGDALSFVVDVLAVLPGSKISDQPDVTVTPSAAVTTVTKKDLVVGTGDSPQVGKKFAVRIMLFRADTAELVTSTWGAAPVVFDFGPGSNTFPGILAVADGMKVGGRRLAQLPYSQIFDGKGNANLKVPAAVDLFIVIDLVAVY